MNKTKKETRGRPKSANPRVQKITVVVSKAEEIKLKRHATNAQVSLSSFIRDSALEKIEKK